MLRTAVVLLNRVLRARDHPALAEAARTAEHVIPLFVFDEAVLASFGAPNRVRFLLDALRDLEGTLGTIVFRQGDVVAETVRVAREAGAEAVHASADVSAYARRREERLACALEAERIGFHLHPGVTVVPPTGEDRIFTRYWRGWQRQTFRLVLPSPGPVRLPAGLDAGALPRLAELTRGKTAAELPQGGETEGRARAERWLPAGAQHYRERNNFVAADETSRLSPYLHLGCVSPLELVARLRGDPSAEPFVRQLAWRDFYAQLLAANPRLPYDDLQSRGDDWLDDAAAFEAWREGRTGYPLVDAGMRQLEREGWMHNRARLVTASFLVKDLYLDWRLGAAHFFDHLVDGDLANNCGNWQWVAGTAVDPRPYRIFNPTLQAQKFDPEGDYVRRYVPELRGIEGAAVHEPRKLDGGLAPLEYPKPIVDHLEAVRRFRDRRREDD